MALIGMSDAGARWGVSGDSAKRALQKAGVNLHKIHPRAYAVDEEDLERFIAEREAKGYSGRGRPPGTFKPESPRSRAHRKGKS